MESKKRYKQLYREAKYFTIRFLNFWGISYLRIFLAISVLHITLFSSFSSSRSFSSLFFCLNWKKNEDFIEKVKAYTEWHN